MFSWLVKIVITLLLMQGIAFAEDVSFAWDANTEPDLAGYRIFRSTISGQYDYSNPVVDIPCGANDLSCCTGTDFGLPDGTYYWVCRAYDTEGYESEDSVEVTKTVVNAGGDLNAPTNFRIVTIE